MASRIVVRAYNPVNEIGSEAVEATGREGVFYSLNPDYLPHHDFCLSIKACVAAHR
jgi:hypothetical protein